MEEACRNDTHSVLIDGAILTCPFPGTTGGGRPGFLPYQEIPYSFTFR